MMKFQNETERDFYDYLVKQKQWKEAAACRCIEHLRGVQSLDTLIMQTLEMTMSALKYLNEYKETNLEKYNGWARATKNYTKEELDELHRWMRMD